ncbi:MAG: hypothetical protein WC799_23165 [Desulfobacteraceae bacterium]|jgi:hypothetical protein
MAIFEELSPLRWPKKGDNPFKVKDGDRMSPAWISLKWLATMQPNDTIYAEAFKRSGDKLVDALCQQEIRSPSDIYFMPITYLYRHSLEIQLKEIIKFSLRLGLIEETKSVSKVIKKHGLHELWNYARKGIEAFWPRESLPDDAKNDVDHAERIILEFHKIDMTGQSLRYPQDTKGNNSLKDTPEAVELTQIKDVFKAIYNFLGGCSSGLSDAIDNMPDY